jgi:hypothetical protein
MTDEEREKEREEKWRNWKVPRMEDDAIRQFVDDFVSNRIFTDRHIPVEEHPRMVGCIFLALGLAPLHLVPEEEVKNIGCVWQYMHERAECSVNGYPMFWSCRFMHMDDWKRAATAILKEFERRKNIEV